MPASPPQYHLCCQSLDRCSYVGPPRGRASGTLPPAARIESRFSLGTSGYGASRWLGPRKNDNPADPTSWPAQDRKSTRLNSSHGYISYAVFCLKKKKKKKL